MSWRDRLRNGSFRGVGFHVRFCSQLGGRRTVVHEYPFRDVPFVEDFGRAPRQWRIDGYLLGEDYDLERERLITALEEEGAGELVHPYRGAMRVAVTWFEVLESREEGRIAGFSAVFLETQASTVPVATPSPEGTARRASEKLIEGSEEGAIRVLRVDGPGYVLDSITAAIETAQHYLTSLQLTGLPGPVRNFLDAVGGLVDFAIGVAYDPTRLVPELTRTVRLLVEGWDGRLEAIRALDGLHGLSVPVAEGIGFWQGVAATNAATVLRHLRAVAVAEQVRLAAEEEYSTLDDALLVRGLLEERIEALLLIAGDDELAALEALAAALAGAVPPPGKDLPRLTTIRPRTATPSLVLAYELYDSRAREAELVARNRVRLRRPAFAPAGEPLEVLTA